ncbi:cellulase family glycosylhydrolase [Roseibacterium sp. SDUM158016]|uniref:cellulase family glycosylhydrolase n=1 Tax=Roseicyclus sediminis TaxID=2980997 RepID=UPI0021D156BC|nr:cellulase family glycosylhydrolase [Roseibacterium sp. SDUM158016]MCU4651438.1 cellulase family glycosylhydrolase [Roseibacterium sp. SDUM158016]
MSRWTEAEAQAWWAKRPWVCGFNYLPSTAVNFLEMWHRDSFDPATIERELGWAAAVGFNAFRINLHYLLWKHDRDGLIDRLDRVMGMAHRAGISTIPVPFDDCGFGGEEPVHGPQPDPVPGVHNSRAVASPGRARLADETEDAQVRAYLTDVLAQFREDPRVLLWDLYNEPGNRMIFGREGAAEHLPDFTGRSLALLRDSFAIARTIGPAQPVTAGAWSTAPVGSEDPSYQTAADQFALDNSDVVTFHAYLSTPKVAAIIDTLAARRRPMLCTEWMARPVGSRIDDQLALFRARGVGCIQWGLVRGRSQTWLPWPQDLVAAHGGSTETGEWFHDLLDTDGTAYDPAEIAVLRAVTSGQRNL